MNWTHPKNILCIRPDNMGDLIMSAPAIRALKESFGARITVLTSSMAKAVIPFLPEIDDAIIFDLPWVKTNEAPAPGTVADVVSVIKQRNFDAAVIFTVYSQSALPTAMLAYMAGIPQVLAYCRENPYQLINCWVPDQEPYSIIKHQVQRDLDLVAAVGAKTNDNSLHLKINEDVWEQYVAEKLANSGINPEKPWLILHAGVSERKRQYPQKLWAAAAKRLIDEGWQILLTGSTAERQLTDHLHAEIGEGSYPVAGLFSIEEFIALIKHAPVMLSVNTGTVHIAAAVGTAVVVLYAQTNPQHTPWEVAARVLPFPVPAHLRSHNEVIIHVNKTVYSQPIAVPTPDDIIGAVKELLSLPGSPVLPSPGIPYENQAIAAS